MEKTGVMIGVRAGTDIDEKFRVLHENSLSCCQLSFWDPSLYSEETAKNILSASEKYDVEVSTVWAGWTGPKEWNFTFGPSTLGIVPPCFRAVRCEEIIKGGYFAKRLGVKRFATHAGFMPENPSDPEYRGIVAAVKYIAARFVPDGISFLFETGQETPVTLLRVIEDTGLENVGINFDTANLILYGKGNSADAVTVFGKYILDTHIKDGFYPTDGSHLGKEVKVGDGAANIPEVISRLRKAGYKGNYIIEREISGEQQLLDIIETRDFLKKILAEN